MSVVDVSCYLVVTIPYRYSRFPGGIDGFGKQAVSSGSILCLPGTLPNFRSPQPFMIGCFKFQDKNADIHWSMNISMINNRIGLNDFECRMNNRFNRFIGS